MDEQYEHPSHKKQREEGVAKSLEDAGIPRSMHKKELTDYPEGAAIIEWLNEHVKTKFETSCGITFSGNTVRNSELAIVTAKSLHKRGFGAIVLPLSIVIDAVHRDTDYSESIYGRKILVIRNVSTPAGMSLSHGRCYEDSMLLYELLEERSLNKKPTFIVANGDLIFGSTLSNEVLQLINHNNKILITK